MGPSINYLTKEQYEALEPVSSNIYICTDTHEAFKGVENLQDVIKYAVVKPEVGIENSIYCVNKNLFLYHENEWIDITQTILDQVEIILDPTKHVTKEQLKDAMEEVEGDVPAISFESLYAKVKAAGYKGTENIFVAQLAEVLNYTDKIMYNEEYGVPVVEVGGVEYASVSEAFAAAEPNSTITFTRNAVLDAPAVISANDVTLDMNGKLLELDNHNLQISGANVKIENANIADNSDIANPALASVGIYITEGSSVEIKDSAIDSRTREVIYVSDGSSLVLDNVIVSSSLKAEYAATSYDSKSLIIINNADVTIKSGSIIADTSSDLECGLYPISAWGANRIELGDATTHEGPTIIGNSACIGSNNTNEGLDTIIIHGGNYKSLMTHPQWMGVIYAAESANITIDGGTFDGGDYDLALPYKKPDYNVSITDGVFNGKVVIKKDYKSGGTGPDTGDTIAITGGNYAYEVPAEFIAEGYGCAKTADGRYEILPVDQISDAALVHVGTSGAASGSAETPAGPEGSDDL